MVADEPVYPERVMTRAEAREGGVEVLFADGRSGVVPFSAIPEIGDLRHLKAIELPNAFEIVLHGDSSDPVELPWDFVRHYCDPAYRPRIEALAAAGREALGERVRHLRETAGLTQEALAQSAGIGRVTLVRIERGEQSPRYDTLIALSRALGRDANVFFEPV
jgi:DNA-binding XRE family transcriptional regulator